MESRARFGFTTGSCAAAAAKAAITMLLSGKEKNQIQIITPAGIAFDADIVDITRLPDKVSCAVIKDGGDDPDITTGAHVCATVSIDSAPEGDTKADVVIDGGFGVGRVTKPGLDQPVGNAAINHVPRQMIEQEVLEVCRLYDFGGRVNVIISVPEGEQLAGSTFNPRLGIEGGISIIGTSGIVEPMSSKALLETIKVELNQKKAMGSDLVAISPGNYGVDFMLENFGYDLDKSVKCSNFIGDTIDMVVEAGFRGMLLTGHIGKLIKVSGGMMNTHSKEGDCRMELLCAAALHAGADAKVAKDILGAVTTEEGIRILHEESLVEASMEYVMERVMYFLNKRAAGKLEIQCMIYATEFGLLAQSVGAKAMLEALMEV